MARNLCTASLLTQVPPPTRDRFYSFSRSQSDRLVASLASSLWQYFCIFCFSILDYFCCSHRLSSLTYFILFPSPSLTGQQLVWLIVCGNIFVFFVFSAFEYFYRVHQKNDTQRFQPKIYSSGRILLIQGCFRTRISCLNHMGTLIIPIKCLKCLKNASTTIWKEHYISEYLDFMWILRGAF